MRPNLVVVTWTPRKLLSANKFEGRRDSREQNAERHWSFNY
jgi:hypothetical protein